MSCEKLRPFIFILFLALFIQPSTSHAVSYGISWIGAKGYRMEGTFSFSDSLHNTGRISGADLDSFRISGFQNSTPLGSFQLGNTPINFNFDSVSQQFFTGGMSDSPSGQRWNVPSTDMGFGFFSGNSTQGLYVNGQLVTESEIRIGATVNVIGIVPSTLEATPIHESQVPEPSSLILMSSGLLGILLWNWSRKIKAQTQGQAFKEISAG